jgi:hypothetical protein
LLKNNFPVECGKFIFTYFETNRYFRQYPSPKHLKRYGRLERPQLLMKNGKLEYLFTPTQGGKFNTANGFVLKIE